MKLLMYTIVALVTVQSFALTRAANESWNCSFKSVAPNQRSHIEGTAVKVDYNIMKQTGRAMVYPICRACMVKPRVFDVVLVKYPHNRSTIFENKAENFKLTIRQEEARQQDNAFGAHYGRQGGTCILTLK